MINSCCLQVPNNFLPLSFDTRYLSLKFRLSRNELAIFLWKYWNSLHLSFYSNKWYSRIHEFIVEFSGLELNRRNWFASRCQEITVVISGWTFIGAAWNFMHLLIYASGRRIKAIRCSSKSQPRFSRNERRTIAWNVKRRRVNTNILGASRSPATFDLTLIPLLTRVDRVVGSSLQFRDRLCVVHTVTIVGYERNSMNIFEQLTQFDWKGWCSLFFTFTTEGWSAQTIR